MARKFEDLIHSYFTDRDLEAAEKLGRELSKLESVADKGKREFMRALNDGAFLPNFRADLAWLAPAACTILAPMKLWRGHRFSEHRRPAWHPARQVMLVPGDEGG